MGSCCANTAQEKESYTATPVPMHASSENLEVKEPTKIKESNETPSSPIRSEKIDV